METGKTVVLLNLENLYESLYDALNQVCSDFYIILYNKFIALQFLNTLIQLYVNMYFQFLFTKMLTFIVNFIKENFNL